MGQAPPAPGRQNEEIQVTDRRSMNQLIRAAASQSASQRAWFRIQDQRQGQLAGSQPPAGAQPVPGAIQPVAGPVELPPLGPADFGRVRPDLQPHDPRWGPRDWGSGVRTSAARLPQKGMNEILRENFHEQRGYKNRTRRAPWGF